MGNSWSVLHALKCPLVTAVWQDQKMFGQSYETKSDVGDPDLVTMKHEECENWNLSAITPPTNANRRQFCNKWNNKLFAENFYWIFYIQISPCGAKNTSSFHQYEPLLYRDTFTPVPCVLMFMGQVVFFHTKIRIHKFQRIFIFCFQGVYVIFQSALQNDLTLNRYFIPSR